MFYTESLIRIYRVVHVYIYSKRKKWPRKILWMNIFMLETDKSNKFTVLVRKVDLIEMLN